MADEMIREFVADKTAGTWFGSPDPLDALTRSPAAHQQGGVTDDDK